MATSKKASGLARPYQPPPPAPMSSSGDSPETGQSYGERVSKGRKEVALWLDEDRITKLSFLQKKLGLKWPKNVVEKAIDEMYMRYQR